MDEGRSAGVTGIIDLSGFSAKFNVWVRNHALGIAAALLPAGGRGDGYWPEVRPLSTGGTVTVGGDVSLDGYPLPTQFNGVTGTLVILQHTGVSFTYSVRVTSAQITKSAKDSGPFTIVLACTIVEAPTLAGFAGSQPTQTEPAHIDKVLWEGLSTMKDPLGLQGGATRRLLVWGISDDDATEETKIDLILGMLAAPYPELKIRTGTFTRLSSQAAYVDVTFGLTDTAEDIINPATQTTIDPQGLQSNASTAAINGTAPTPFDEPYEDGEWVLRSRRTQEINDDHDLEVAEWGERSTEADIEYPGTWTKTESSAIGSNAQITAVTTDSSPPAAPAAPLGVLVFTSSVQQDDGHWIHTREYANSTAAEKIVYDGSRVEYDPSALEDGGSVSAIANSATPPATPTAPVSGTKLRARYSQRIQTTPEKWKHTFIFARRTTQDDIEMPGTYTKLDVSDLESEGRQTLVYDLPGAAPGPTVPSGLQNVGNTIKVENDGKGVVVYEYAKDTPQQVVEQRATFTEEDPNAIGSKAAVGLVDGSPALPAGYKEISRRTQNLTNDHVLETVEGAINDSIDNIELPGTVTQGFGDDARIDTITTVSATADLPAAIGTANLPAMYLDPTFDGLTIRKITDALAAVTVRYRENIRRATGEIMARGNLPTVVYLDLDDGTPRVFLADRYQVTSTQWAYLLLEQPCPFAVAIIEFGIEYRDTSAVLPHHGDLLNTKNGDVFLGLPAAKVAYVGLPFSAILNAGGENSGPARVVQKLYADGRGIVNPSQFAVGVWCYTDEDLTALEPRTWVDPDDLGIDYEEVPDGDYSVLFT